MNPDALISPAINADSIHTMSTFFQVSKDFIGYARFGSNNSPASITRLTGRCGMAHVFDSGCLACCLNIHAEIQQVDQHLDLTLRLHITPMTPKTNTG